MEEDEKEQVLIIMSSHSSFPLSHHHQHHETDFIPHLTSSSLKCHQANFHSSTPTNHNPFPHFCNQDRSRSSNETYQNFNYNPLIQSQSSKPSDKYQLVKSPKLVAALMTFSILMVHGTLTSASTTLLPNSPGLISSSLGTQPPFINQSLVDENYNNSSSEEIVKSTTEKVSNEQEPSLLELLNLTLVMKSPPVSNSSIEELIMGYLKKVECENPSIIPFLLNGSILITPKDLDPNVKPAHTDGLGRCPVYWDTLICWPMTPEGVKAYVRCPAQLGGIEYDSTQNATRECTWHRGWEHKADYQNCKPKPLRESDILKVLWDAREALTIYYIGYGLSLVALSIALWIFLYFKDLRCVRNTIHTNLMITYVLSDLTWIILATLQSHPSPALSQVSCYSWIALHYFIGANFCWMLIEGLYLYILVVKTFSIELINIHNYMIIGYGFPAVIVIIWAPLKYHFSGITSDNLVSDSCTWQTRNAYDYMFVCPMLLVLLVNIFFLGKIMYVLITKLRAATTAESQQYRKAAKALLVLIPLLGVTYLLVIVTPPQRTAKMIFTYLQAALLSTQGFSVAVLYCFLNNEVRQSIIHHFERWKTIRTLRGGEYPVAPRNATFAFRSMRYGEGMKLYRAPARKSIETSTIGSRNSSLDQGSTCGHITCGQRFECPGHRNSNGVDSGRGSNATRSDSGQSGFANRSSCGTLTVPRSSCTSSTSVVSSLTGQFNGGQRKKSSELAVTEKLLSTNCGQEHNPQNRSGSGGSTHSSHSDRSHGNGTSTSIMIGSKDRRGSRAGGMNRRSDNFNYTSVRREEVMY